MPNDAKYCVNCRNYNDYNALCVSPRNPVSLITGKSITQNVYHARETKELCGAEGKFFEQKQ